MKVIEIKKRIMELIDQKVEKVDGIKILRKEFKGETSQDLVELWRITKEENEINTQNKHTPKKTKENKVETSKLKIVKKVVTVKGEYGTYVKEGNKVKANNLEFNNADDVAKYEKKLIAEEEELFLKRKAEIHSRLIEFVDVMLMEV